MSVFPGAGKSTVAREATERSDLGGPVRDLELARNSNFVEEYVDDIVQEARSPGFVLVSTHAEVRQKLVERGVKFTLVYPEPEEKGKYVERMKVVFDDPRVVEWFNEGWDSLLESCREQRGCDHYVLCGGYLSIGDLAYIASTWGERLGESREQKAVESERQSD